MPITTINFSDVEDFEALPEDEYAVEIDKVEVRSNKAGDGEYLNWELVVLDGDYENRRLWMITSLKPTALFRLKRVFEELDVLDGDEIDLEYDDDEQVTSSSGPRLLYPELEGLECVAKVTNEMYDGRERNRVEDLFTERHTKKTKKRSSTKSSSNGNRATRRRSRDDEEDDRRSTRSRREAPTRSRRRDRDDEDDRYDVDADDDYDDEEEEEEERPPRRRSRSSSRSSSRSGGRRRLR